MDHVRIGDILELAQPHRSPCLSIFIPTHRGGAETLQDPIRLKNQLKEAGQRLHDTGLRSAEIDALLDPLRRLVSNHDFWQHQSGALAAYRSPDLFRYFRIPVQLTDLTIVAGRFHLKPLLRALADEVSFHVLGLSQNGVKLWRCTPFHERETQLPDYVPRSLDETVGPARPEKQLQAHTVGEASKTAIFHGHGAAEEQRKEDILKYFRKVEKGVSEVLRNERAPLVLAGVEYLMPIYRTVNTYPHLLPEGVEGSPDGLRPAELREKAWRIVHPVFVKERESAASAYRQFSVEGRASDDIKKIVRAAHQGRVESLFIAAGNQCWGRFDPHNDAVELHDQPQTGDEDLLDLAAIQTFSHGGTVFAVDPGEMPAKAPAAAVFRY